MVKFGKFSGVKRLRCCVFGAVWTSPSSLTTIPNLSKHICVLHNDAATKGYLHNKMHHDAVFWYVWKNLVLFVVAVVVFFPPLPLFFWQMFGDLMFFFSGYQVKGAYILVCLFAARQMSGLLRMPWSFWGAVGFSTAAIYWHCFSNCSQDLVMSTNRQEGFEQIIHIARITEIDLDCFSK
jgi:hypothetical protein